MLKQSDLTVILDWLQRKVRSIDPPLADALLAEARQKPDEPFLFEYLDRLIAALSKRPGLSATVDGFRECRRETMERWQKR